jgi:uncharacterized membrane protein YhiD involved in acid resistance
MNQESAIRRFLTFAAATFLTASLGVALDAFLMERGLSGISVLYVSDVLIGIVAGALVLEYRSRQAVKHQVLYERIETIREVNQHLRSVLTSLSLYGRQSGPVHQEVHSELLRRVEANLADMFSRMLFDHSLPTAVLKSAKKTVETTAF